MIDGIVHKSAGPGLYTTRIVTPGRKVKKGYDLRGAPYDLTGFFVFSEDSLPYVPIVQTFLLSAHVDFIITFATPTALQRQTHNST